MSREEDQILIAKHSKLYMETKNWFWLNKDEILNPKNLIKQSVNE